MSKLWKIILGALAAGFLLMGLMWLFAPGFISGMMRMGLLTGDGLTTQIGDLASFFLALGGCIAMAVRTARPAWLYPAAMLLGFAAAGRLIAWLLHGAGLTLDMILFEVVAASLLLFVAGKMTAAEGRQSSSH